MEILAHLLLIAAFATIVFRRKAAGMGLFLMAVVFTLMVFALHATDRLKLNF